MTSSHVSRIDGERVDIGAARRGDVVGYRFSGRRYAILTRHAARRSVERYGAMTAVVSGLRAEVTDDDLVRISEANPGWQFERTDDGDLLVSPTSTDGGAKSAEALGQLYLFAKRVGGKAYDSSTGFKTPRGGVVSPDAAWVSAARVAAMDRKTYQALMPDIVVEVASQSHAWNTVQAKIDKYAADGAAYATAIDPSSRAVYERGNRPAGLELDVDAIIDA